MFTYRTEAETETKKDIAAMRKNMTGFSSLAFTRCAEPDDRAATSGSRLSGITTIFLASVLTLGSVMSCAETPTEATEEESTEVEGDPNLFSERGERQPQAPEHTARTGIDPLVHHEPDDKIFNGAPVDGAGPSQRWEGIVKIFNHSRDTFCTGFFVTAQHVVTAGHCYAYQGIHSVTISAPTLGSVDFSAWVNRQGTSRSIDVAVLTLSAPLDWANAQRRFRLYAGSTSLKQLQIYGYGATAFDGTNSNSQGLNGAPGRTLIQMNEHQDGWFKATAHTARICKGDSGGPAIKEDSLAIVWGIASSVDSPVERQCAAQGNSMYWSKVNYNLDYIERAIGFRCSRRTSSEGWQYAQCW